MVLATVGMPESHTHTHCVLPAEMRPAMAKSACLGAPCSRIYALAQESATIAACRRKEHTLAASAAASCLHAGASRRVQQRCWLQWPWQPRQIRVGTMDS